MSTNSFFRSLTISVFLFGFFSFFIPVFAQLQFDSIASKLTYPVRELGNCNNATDCQAYCTHNTNTCLAYFVYNGYITKEEALKTQTAISSTVPGPTITTTTTPPDTTVTTAPPPTGATSNITTTPITTTTLPLTTSTTNTTVTAPSYTGVSVTLSVPITQKIQGSVVLYVNAPLATKVQILASNSTSIIPIILGEATRGSTGQWVFVWNTTLRENGTYILTPRIVVNTAIHNGMPISVSVYNTSTPPVVAAPSASDLSTLSQTISNTKDDVIVKQDEATKTAVLAASNYVKTISQNLASTTKTEETRTWLQIKEQELIDLAKTASQKTATGTGGVSKEINPSLVSIKTGAEEIFGGKIATSTADKELASQLGKAEASLSEAQTLLADRVGTAVTTDSDGDGVSDYDELFIYGTNILSADTDGDSITDDTEIEKRTSPTSSSTQVIIPEDVKTVGQVAKDLLTVTDIKAGEVGTDAKGKSELKTMIFRGKALPNSFVTLFIFSDPIIVTVRTNGEGEWEYKFNDTKTLPDGRHEVYTAVVGNAGKILAKSDPMPFVKQAEAVSFGENITPEKPSVLSTRSIIIIVSLVGLAIIGVLVLIGVSRRNKNNAVGPQPPAPPPLANSL
jgi:hypothetical protein